MERIAAAEQQADQQLMEAAMRKDAQEEAADKQAKAERKAEQLRYRCAPTLPQHAASASCDSMDWFVCCISDGRHIPESSWLQMLACLSRFKETKLCTEQTKHVPSVYLGSAWGLTAFVITNDMYTVHPRDAMSCKILEAA